MSSDAVQSFSTAPLRMIDGDRGKNYPNGTDFSATGDCLFLSARNVTKSGFLFDDNSFISAGKDASLRAGRLVRGDVVITTRGTVGNVAYFDDSVPFESVRINSGMLILRTDESLLHSRYLYFFVRSYSFVAQIESLTSGSAQPQLPVRDLGNVMIPIPSMHEQRAIADVLGALDEKIAANTKLAQTSAILAQALLAGAIRATNHEVALSDVTDLLSRGIAPKYSDAEDTMVVLNQKCIRDQRVNLDPARRTLISKVRKDKMLRMNDVLVNSTGQGTLGRVARWTQSGGVTVDSHITIVRFDPAKADPVCAGMALLASQQTIKEMGEGSTGQTELSRTELGKLRLRLPERSQQAELGHRIKSMSEMESARLRENQTLAATRDTLLPQLMSGNLRVKDAEKVLQNVGV